ncbi:MAG: carbon-nitrogen hydrolase family protein [Planctomycetota bacterium]
MLIACVQSDVSFAAPRENLRRVLGWLEKTSDVAQNRSQSADFIVFPECMLTGYAFDSREQAAEIALSQEDPLFTEIADALARRDQFASIGFVESAGERLYNAAALVGPRGIESCYRKLHLPHLGVDRFVDRGDRPYRVAPLSSSRCPDVRVGLAICYDGSFPEPSRVLALCGADVIALGTNWPDPATHTARIVPPARSMENHVYFVAANRVGQENGFSFFGRSSICGPDGVVLAESDDNQETVLFAKVDPLVARNKRIERDGQAHTIDRFADRCPEFYQKLVEPQS